MVELEIVDNDFGPLCAAQSPPQILALEDCDLVANGPPRGLAGLEQLDLTDCALNAEALARWLAACPDLTSLDIEGSQLGDLSWSIFPMRLQQLAIRGGKLRSMIAPRAHAGLQVLELTACKLQRVELPGSLASLKRISLAFNEQLGECPDLPWSATPFDLDLRGCGLTAWPDADGVDKVGKLDASDNAICAVPQSADKFHSLGCLRLQKCRVASIDGALCSLPHLRELWLADNPLRQLPEALRGVKNLAVLELVRCQLDGWPEQLENATRLEALLLDENQIGHVPDYIVECKQLRNLSLCKTGLRALPASLRGLDALDHLDLSYNPLATLPDLSELPALGHLGLCGLRDLDWQQGFDRLANLARIKTISFTNSNFTSFDRRVLDIPALARLNVNKTSVDASVWRECREAYPNLTIWAGA